MDNQWVANQHEWNGNRTPPQKSDHNITLWQLGTTWQFPHHRPSREIYTHLQDDSDQPFLLQSTSVAQEKLQSLLHAWTVLLGVGCGKVVKKLIHLRHTQPEHMKRGREGGRGRGRVVSGVCLQHNRRREKSFVYTVKTCFPWLHLSAWSLIFRGLCTQVKIHYTYNHKHCWGTLLSCLHRRVSSKHRCMVY